MVRKTTVESMFTLWAAESNGDFVPEDIHVELGIIASKSWRKNDPFSVGTGVRKQGGWQYSTGREEFNPEAGIDFFSQLLKIKEFLKNHKSQIVSACKRHSLTPELSCVMHVVGSDRPGIGYDSELIALLGEVKAEVDVDVYFSAV